MEWGYHDSQEKLLYCQPLLEMGVKHLFATKEYQKEKIFDYLKLDVLHQVKQAHTDIIWQFEKEPQPLEADGIFIRRKTERREAFLLKTADCLPIIFATKDYIALVHAGWRGIVNGIIENVIKLFQKLQQEKISIAIGPAASFDLYQVKEDLHQIFSQDKRFSNAILRKLNNEKWLFNLGLAAKEIIKANFTSAEIYDCHICTIKETKYASHRREPTNQMRNLTVIF
jgi:hypothetical protein